MNHSHTSTSRFPRSLSRMLNRSILILLVFSLFFPQLPISQVSAQAEDPEQPAADSELLLGEDFVLDEPVTDLVERVYVPPTAEELALTQVQVDSFNCNTVSDVPTTECGALVALYESTNGAGWSNNTNWLSSTIVGSWYGVSVKNQHVEAIGLSSNQLSGSIPSDLGTLSNLQNLDLDTNLLTDSIPPELGNLSNLKTLYLNSNLLTDSIPPELGNLSNLENLDLDTNQLSGSIPPELGKLSNLYSLSLVKNQLSSSIPTELGNLSKLLSLYLSENQLSGLIPSELDDLSNLKYLYLSGNQLSGTIPPGLGNLSDLQNLRLDSNQLSGSIPPKMGNLSNLYELHLYSNQLSGSIPPELGNLSNLYYLDLSGNQLSGSIPSELDDLSKMNYLYLSGNQLSGSIPPGLGNLSKLYELHLDSNPLSGSIPLSFTNLTKMKEFYFFNTALCEPASGNYLDWKATVTDYQGTGISCSVSPKDDEKLSSSKVTFDWSDVPGATSYKIQLSTKEDFSSTVFSVKVTESTYPYLTSLLFNKTYYWRVRGLVNDVWGNWVSYRFYSMDPLAAPVLANPPDAALLYPNFTLTWNAVVNAARYQLQLARDSAFTDRVFNGKLSDTFKGFNDLVPGKYYWRVKAIEEGGLKGPWSEVRGFTVTKIMPPDLWTPADDATVGPNVTLTWEAVVGAAKFKLQVSKDAAFTKLIVNEKTTDPAKDLTGLAARNYYWRVKAIDADGFKSPWSQVWKFTVSTTP